MCHAEDKNVVEIPVHPYFRERLIGTSDGIVPVQLIPAQGQFPVAMIAPRLRLCEHPPMTASARRERTCAIKRDPHLQIIGG